MLALSSWSCRRGICHVRLVVVIFVELAWTPCRHRLCCGGVDVLPSSCLRHRCWSSSSCRGGICHVQLVIAVFVELGGCTAIVVVVAVVVGASLMLAAVVVVVSRWHLPCASRQGRLHRFGIDAQPP